MQNINVMHILLDSPFMDDSSYQETCLAKYHNRLCKNVCILTVNEVLKKGGKVETCGEKTYTNKDGVKIIRINVWDKKKKRKLFFARKVYSVLKNERPDFIMMHGVGGINTLAIAIYKRKVKKNCIVIADSHATSMNYQEKITNLRTLIYRIILNFHNHYMCHFFSRVYGITPNAIEVMVKNMGIVRKKTDILSLGYDEELIDFGHYDEVRASMRKKLQIPQSAFVIVHGGKLDTGKRTLELVRCVKGLPNNIYMVIFGDFKDLEYEKLVFKERDERIILVGMLEQKEIYNMYLMSDMAAFPGTPSCLRQEAVAAGIPIIISYDKSDEGINLLINQNGICLSQEWNTEELTSAIIKIYGDVLYKERAWDLSQGFYKQFSYKKQAEMLIYENMRIKKEKKKI